MAYLSQFEFDIYISSASVDNQPSPGEHRGWVDLFHQSLEVELSKRIGRLGAIRAWRDVSDFRQYDQRIREAIEGSALFLALISPGYLHSSFCQTELRTFCENARNSRFGVAIDDRSRILPVFLERMEISEWPEEIAKLGVMGFPFYVDDAGWSMHEVGHPTDPGSQKFQEQLRLLAQAIIRTLQTVKSLPETEPSEPFKSVESPEPAPSVERAVVVEPTRPEPVQPGASSVFISYRRDESTPYAGRLYDNLAKRFGNDRVFMDLDTIEPGDDFVDVITDYVSSCSILIAVIGKAWLEVKDEQGQPRLHNPEDFVSLEISVALKRGIRVIPVLVQGAAMPRSQDLPESLAKLSRRNALELSDSRWSYDVNRLIQVLEKDLNRT